MRFSVEVLEHIFSFLVSHKDTLFACSKDTVLSPIVERQLFFHTTVGFATGWLDCTFQPDRLSKAIVEDPRILNYVRILEIRVETDNAGYQDPGIQKQLNEFAPTLRLFPLLERIVLTTPKGRRWQWPEVFRSALENRLSFPTVKEAYFVGYQDLPFSLIGNCKNIENVLLEGVFRAPAVEFDEEDEEDEDEEDEEDGMKSRPAPGSIQLKDLTLCGMSHSLHLVDLHIKKLQSLKCANSSVEDLSGLLGVCSGTLKKLDIDLTYSRYSTQYKFATGGKDDQPFTTLSPIPPNLQQLVVRAPVLVENEMDEEGIFTPKRCWSYLPAIRDIINLFIPAPQHLVLDVNIHLFDFSSNLANIDFSPLAILGAAAMSIPRIDLYVHTDILPSDVTSAQLLSWLTDYDDVMRAIEKGILFIHSERTAPDYVQD